MDAEQFLDRVVAPGNFIAVAYKPPGRGMGHKFFRREDVGQAAGYIRWAGTKGIDVWYGMASYADAQPKINARGQQEYEGKREQTNTQQIRSFWLDLDLKREGDGKDPSKVYADAPAAVAWIKSFVATTGMPLPNVWVNSGYGLHLYWVVEDPMPVATWKPYAEALKAAVMATGGLADLVVIADNARILRPPQSVNMKDPAKPAAVKVLDKQTRADYPNDLIYQKLQPYVGLIQSAPAATTVGAGLAGGGPAAAFANRQSTTAVAAQANRTVLKDKSFATIATKCLQVKNSLAVNGASDNRSTWYLGHLSLAHHCQDGDQYVHPISSGHPTYNPLLVDAEVARIAAEKAKHDSGPPRCTTYNANNPGTCQGCPFFGKVTSPWNLGADHGDLPDGYRRDSGKIQKMVVTKDGTQWNEVIVGDVYAPALDRTGDAYTLSFTYERAGKKSAVIVDQAEFRYDTNAISALFAMQGVSLNRLNAIPFGDFIMAWIEKLRDQSAERNAAVEPFGWAKTPDGKHGGFAVAGRLYKPDGSTEQAPGADRQMVELYRPRGSLDAWKTAAAFVTKNRPDLQVIIAAGLGSPLMKFTGEPGAVLSFYSRDSGVGKSSAFKIGQSAWASLKAMSSLSDTPNAVRAKIGDARVMPCFYDEMRVDKENSRSIVNMFYELAQGKDKARLGADSSHRKVSDWRTLMIIAGNMPLMDVVVAATNGTDAGSLRVMEFEIDQPALLTNTKAGALMEDGAEAVGRAGEVLARFYAENHDMVKDLVQGWKDKLHAALAVETNERFYLAAVACVLTGAQIAKRLQLVDFDIEAMMGFIKSNWVRLRAARRDLSVNNGKVNLPDVFGRFYSEMSPRRLITTAFVRRGFVDPTIRIVQAPATNSVAIAVHVGQNHNAIRIDRNALDLWCRAAGLAPTVVVKAMETTWGARQDRVIFGAGAPGYECGRTRIVEIPLTHPDLADYVTAPAAPTQAVKQAPSAAIQGNQPKV